MRSPRSSPASTRLTDVPALLLWGPSDPVFSDIYLRDLEARLPQADVHRFVGASHLVAEDADVAGAVHEWVAQQRHAAPPIETPLEAPVTRAPAWAGPRPARGRHRRRDDRDDGARGRVDR